MSKLTAPSKFRHPEVAGEVVLAPRRLVDGRRPFVDRERRARSRCSTPLAMDRVAKRSPATPGASTSRRWWLVVGIGLLVVEAWRFVDLRGAFGALVTLGPLAAVALIPYALLLVCETLGWRTVCGAIGLRVGFGPLLRVRLAGTAASAAVPAGAIFADGIKPALLRRSDGVPLPATLATLMGNKVMLVTTHAAYLITATALGWSALAGASPRLLGSTALPWLCVATSSVLAMAASGLLAALAHDDFARRLRSFLPLAWHAKALELDRHLVRLRSTPLPVLMKGASFYFSSWCCEALESFVLLSLVGVHLRFVDVMALDAAVGVLRSCAFAVPSGLGVTDASYVMLLGAYGVPDALALGPAFVVLKRAKELCWLAGGTAVFVWMTDRRRLSPSGASAFTPGKFIGDRR
jgi:uncharacterized membrane protein YbhN (UPF0104 family)